MKFLVAVAAVVLLLGACAYSGSGASSGAGTGSISMYGTIDEGISVRK